MLNAIKAILALLRYGKITSRIVSYECNCISEVAFLDRKGRYVGYWAFGDFDPSLPYQGQQWWRFSE